VEDNSSGVWGEKGKQTKKIKINGLFGFNLVTLPAHCGHAEKRENGGELERVTNWRSNLESEYSKKGYI